MNEFKDVYDANNLINSFRKSKKSVGWKESVQRYELNLLENINVAQKAIKNGTYKQKDFYEFTLCERGKTRHIKSLHISDRVVQRSVCENVLNPLLEKYLIYDNGASVKGKGVQFTRKRLDTHLKKYYQENQSNEGYILLIDFQKFFDNISHEKLMESIKEKITEENSLRLIEYLIGTFSIDVSYMSDEEFSRCEKELFDSLSYYKKEKKNNSKEKIMRKSLGIGSQISQISGLFYPTRIDNYCKIVKGMKYYGRYMDDIYIIHKDKELLKNLLRELKEICNDMGIFINEKKTQVCKLKQFTYLKTKYTLTESGKIIHKMCHDNIVRERRKLKKFKKLMDKGKMKKQDIQQAYKSWRGNAEKYDSYQSICNMDQLYKELFYG